MAIFKTIARYDSTQGTLTDYLQFWLRNASSNSLQDHQYGTSYSIPSSRRRNLAKTNWVNKSGYTEYNLSQELDQTTINSAFTLPQDEVAAQALIQQLLIIGIDPDIKLVLQMSGIDYPQERIKTVYPAVRA